jgi:hypothetical protein
MTHRLAVTALALGLTFTAAACDTGGWFPNGQCCQQKDGGFPEYHAALPARIPVEVAQDCYVQGLDVTQCAARYDAWLLSQFGF